MKRSKWDQRIERAEGLAKAHPFAADVLRFYKSIAGFQRALYLQFEKANSNSRPPSAFPQEPDFQLLLSRFPQFLGDIASITPSQLAFSATHLKSQLANRWDDLLASLWRNPSAFRADPGQSDALLAWIFLQPYAEFLADHAAFREHSESVAVCPLCSARPQVGVLRQEGDGAKRSLICSLCSTEWTYARLVCPACDEKDVKKLAVYTAEQFPHVRVEACDSCHHYIKTVDLTKNGLAVPVVDELATIPLNLWAQENGYLKLSVNLLGI